MGAHLPAAGVVGRVARPWRRVAVLCTALAACQLLAVPTHSSQAAFDPLRPPPNPLQPRTLFGVGDIMHCHSPGSAEATGRLMEQLLIDTPGSIGVTFGDNSNDDGSESSYECFDRSAWGKLMSRLFPVPGNHDYGVDKELPYYFLYFPNAGTPRLGYHAYDVGAWRVYALNSDLVLPELRLAQLAWLESDLSVHHKTKCLLAYFHRPPFSSGNFASPKWALPIFRKLYKYGVDLVATGHEHFFASLPPLNPQGVVDRSYGVPILIAGTGGAVLFDRPRQLRYGNDGEFVLARAHGVLRLTLSPGRYEWRFLPVDRTIGRPVGEGACHPNPPGFRD